eukprot:2681575-Pyramimonas_sp.AAC.2
MVQWFQTTLEEMSRKHIIPLVFMNLNGGLPSSNDDKVAGPCGYGKEIYASVQLRPCLEGWGLAAANTHYVNPPSYVGNNNASYIDHICIPVEMLGSVERCNVLCEAGRRLQLHDVGEVRDRRPVQLVVRLVAGLRPLPERAPRPNREALFCCLQQGHRRQELFDVMERKCEELTTF